MSGPVLLRFERRHKRRPLDEINLQSVSRSHVGSDDDSSYQVAKLIAVAGIAEGVARVPHENHRPGYQYQPRSIEVQLHVVLLDHKFVTIVSNLETGEPLWIGKGRDESTLKRWLQSLSRDQKANITLVAMDMHRAYWNAVDNTRGLEHAAIVHDPIHVTKLAGQMLDELRREVFFRAGPELRAIGRGKRWLLLRAWERTTVTQKADLHILLAHNRTLARAYQIKEELRDVLHAPDRRAMEIGLKRILRRTARRDLPALRRLHDTLNERWNEIVALAEHRPPVGRLEALNNNWETLVRRARSYRDHDYLLRKVRFMTANPVRNDDGIRRFLALGITPPLPRRHAA